MSLTLPECSTIAAIIPYYNGRGDSTSILIEDGGQLTCNCRIRTVIARLARSQAADLAELRRQSSNSRHCVLQPLALSPRFVLFPVKVRKPRIKGDPSIGYINLYAAKHIEPNRENLTQALITLTGGHSIASCWTSSTVQRHLQQAKLSAAYSPRTQMTFSVQEQKAAYDPVLADVLRSLTDLFYNIIKLKASQ